MEHGNRESLYYVSFILQHYHINICKRKARPCNCVKTLESTGNKIWLPEYIRIICYYSGMEGKRLYKLLSNTK